MLEARIPSGPIEQKWDKCRYEMKLVNPANRRKHSIIVVGAGLAGEHFDFAHTDERVTKIVP